MLVLSRKEDQSIVFPNLGISVQVARVKGQTVRLGIEAPRSIKIVRGELHNDEDTSADVFQQIESQIGSVDLATRHQVRNHLNTASLSLNVAQQQIEQGTDSEKVNAFLSQAIEALEELNQLFESPAMGGNNETIPLPVGIPLKATTASEHNWTALVVEDNDNERELLAGVLEMAGFEVIPVPDGQAAIEYLSLHARPDLVLMDMNMPRLDGPQTISKIRTDLAANDLPIFGVSGLTQTEANIPLGDRGVTGWFSKPVNPNQLVQYLRQEIEGQVDPAMN